MKTYKWIKKMKKCGLIKVKNNNSDDYDDQYFKGRISSE